MVWLPSNDKPFWVTAQLVREARRLGAGESYAAAAVAEVAGGGVTKLSGLTLVLLEL
jgi:hypothetical protein